MFISTPLLRLSMRRLTSSERGLGTMKRREVLRALDEILTTSKEPLTFNKAGHILQKRHEKSLPREVLQGNGLHELVKGNARPPLPRYIISGDAISLARKPRKLESSQGSSRSTKRQYEEEEEELTVSRINATMHKFAKARDLKSCVTWFKLLAELNMEPDAYTMSILIKAHCEAGDMSGAIKFLNAMNEAGIRPLVYHINPILAAYAKRGDMKSTLHWFEAMQNTDGLYNVAPDKYSFSILLTGHLKAGEPRKAIDLFDMGKRAGWTFDTVMYANLMQAYTHSDIGDLDGALTAFQEMKDKGVPLSEAIYHELIISHGKAGDPIGAEALYDEMKEAGLKPSIVTYTCIVHAFARSGNIERATYWFHQILSAGLAPNRRTLNCMIYAHVRALDVEGARHYFDTMYSSYGIAPDVYSVNMVLGSLKWQDAIDMWSLYFLEGVRAYGGRSSSEQRKTLVPNHNSYNILLRACGNNKKRVQFWFDQMLQSGVEPNERTLKMIKGVMGEKKFIQYCKNVATNDLESELNRELWEVK